MIENKEFVKDCIESGDLWNAVKYIIAEPRELFGDTSGTGLQEATEQVMRKLPQKHWAVDELIDFVENFKFEEGFEGLADWSLDEDDED